MRWPSPRPGRTSRCWAPPTRTFNGPIPCTPGLTSQQCAKDYEYNTGRVIVDLLKEDDQKAAEAPAAPVANHGPDAYCGKR